MLKAGKGIQRKSFIQLTKADQIHDNNDTHDTHSILHLTNPPDDSAHKA
jgi:hypothetical protein